MISFIFSFEIIIIFISDLRLFFWIAASVVYAAAVNPNDTKTFLGNGLSSFLINGKATFINGPKNPNFWFITFSVVPFNKFPIFFRDFHCY